MSSTIDPKPTETSRTALSGRTTPTFTLSSALLALLMGLSGCASQPADESDTLYPGQVQDWVDDLDSNDAGTRHRINSSLSENLPGQASPVLRRLAECAENRRLRNLVDRYLELRHGPVADALDDSEPEQKFLIIDVENALEELIEEIDSALGTRYLAVDDHIDARLLKNLVAYDMARLHRAGEQDERIRAYQLEPDVLLSLFRLTEIQASGTIDDFIARLRILANASQDVRKIPELGSYWAAEAAMRRLQRAVDYIDHLRAAAANWDPSRRPELERLTEPAVLALQDRIDFLRDEVLPNLEGDWTRWGEPVGVSYFNFLVRTRLMLEATPDELLRLGRAQMASIQAEMVQLAQEIAPDRPLRSMLEDLRNDHPTREEMPSQARRDMQEALDFLLRADLVTVPEVARVGKVRLTEGEQAQTYPFGGYGGFDFGAKAFTGYYFVNPPPPDARPEQAAERLRGNNVYWSRVVAVHEMWPGHHLQAVTSELLTNRIRKEFDSALFVEGWGLYAEEMMYRAGYFSDPRTRLAMLQMRLWRAARIVIDVGLHTGIMTPAEAVGVLVHEVSLTPETATLEVRRYLGHPTQPMSYLIGYLLIEQLRAEYKATQGNAFREENFHDLLLGFGPIPVPLIRYAITGRLELGLPTSSVAIPPRPDN